MVLKGLDLLGLLFYAERVKQKYVSGIAGCVILTVNISVSLSEYFQPGKVYMALCLLLL